MISNLQKNLDVVFQEFYGFCILLIKKKSSKIIALFTVQMLAVILIIVPLKVTFGGGKGLAAFRFSVFDLPQFYCDVTYLFIFIYVYISFYLSS